MSAQLTWDTPNQNYDSSLTWDGFAVSAPKTMNNTKAIIDFSDYTDPGLSPVARTIFDSLTENATTFPALPVTLLVLGGQIGTYDETLAARASRAKLDVIAFNDARAELEDSLTQLGNYVNIVAKGNAMIVGLSGFPSYDTSRTPDTSAPAAPTNLRLNQGDLTGSFVARYKPERSPSTNEVQTCTGDPNNEADWQTKGMFRGGRAELGGFTPGTVVWVRVRTVGLKGVMGAWSDPGQIRVL